MSRRIVKVTRPGSDLHRPHTVTCTNIQGLMDGLRFERREEKFSFECKKEGMVTCNNDQSPELEADTLTVWWHNLRDFHRTEVTLVIRLPRFRITKLSMVRSSLNRAVFENARRKGRRGGGI